MGESHVCSTGTRRTSPGVADFRRRSDVRGGKKGASEWGPLTQATKSTWSTDFRQQQNQTRLHEKKRERTLTRSRSGGLRAPQQNRTRSPFQAHPRPVWECLKELLPTSHPKMCGERHPKEKTNMKGPRGITRAPSRRHPLWNQHFVCPVGGWGHTMAAPLRSGPWLPTSLREGRDPGWGSCRFGALVPTF